MKLQTRLATIPVALLAAVGSAHAAVPAAVTTALTDAGADTVTVATAVLGIAVGVWALLIIKRKFFG